MCLFRKIKINGTAYTPEQVERMLAKFSAKIENLEAAEKRIYEELDFLKEKNEALATENHKLSCANGTLRAENRRLREELGDFPARSASGKFVKRPKGAPASAKPEVVPTKPE